MRFIVIFGLLLALVSPLSLAADMVVVLGLFKDKAVVNINGKQRSLSVGQVSPEGIKLISANSHEAVLEIAGKRKTYSLGDTQMGAASTTPDQTPVQLWPNPQGMYTALGSINGLPVNFLVDTGATLIALNAFHAEHLGIDYRRAGQRVLLSTASGVEQGYQVKLNRVRVGGIELRDIAAVVLEGPNPPEALLGMSFLGRVEMRNNGQIMQLRQR